MREANNKKRNLIDSFFCGLLTFRFSPSYYIKIYLFNWRLSFKNESTSFASGNAEIAPS